MVSRIVLITVVLCINAERARAEGRLNLTPNTVAFGDVAVGDSSSIAVTIKNVGNEPVAFGNEQFAGASAFTRSGFELPVTLAVGQSLTFRVKFAPAATGAKSGSLTLSSNAANNRVVVWMNGAGVRPQVTSVPASANFSDVAVGTTNSQTIQLKNAGSSLLTISTASMSGNGFSLSGLRFPLALGVGAKATFDIAFSPRSVGAVTGSATISGNFSTVTVPLSGTAIGGTRVISASARTENFGNVTLGSNATAVVNLTNTGNLSVTILAVSCSGAGVSASGAAKAILDPGQSTALTLSFRPTNAGAVSGSVTVGSNATNSPMTIAISGDGVPAAAHAVTLSWAPSASSGVTGYDVFRSTVSGGPYAQIGSVSALDYTDSTVQAGTEYFYVVTSVESRGARSAYSSQIAVPVP